MKMNISKFYGFMFSVVGDVSIDSEAPMMTSLISYRGLASPVFEGAHRGRYCVRAFIGGECACIVITCVRLCNLKKI